MIKNTWPLCGAWAACLALTACEARAPEGIEPFQGVVEFQEVRLGFEVGGRIVELGADVGDDVTAGKALARLDDDIQRATRSTQESEVEAALAQAELVKVGPRREEVAALAARLRAADAEVSRLARDLERESKLLAEGVTPRVLVDDLTSALERARAERDALHHDLRRLQKGARQQEVSGAEARAHASEAALAVVERRLELYTLSSPQSAHVLERHAELGEVVAPGSPVFTLADIGHPYTDIFVPQARISELSEGTAMEVRIDAQPVPFQGHVESISRKTEFTPRFLFSERERPNLVVRVRVRIADPERRIYAGVPAFVTPTSDATATSHQALAE